MRLAIPFAVADISALARSLEADLAELGHPPKHLEMLNMLAKAAGYGNFQHLRASREAEAKLLPPEPVGPPADLRKVARVGNFFDADGVLMSWPAKTGLQELCVWVFWSRLPAASVFDERQISDMLRDWHDFGDHALLRRTLVTMGLVQRTVDGREYRRIEQKPPAELEPLLAVLADKAKRAGKPV